MKLSKILKIFINKMHFKYMEKFIMNNLINNSNNND